MRIDGVLTLTLGLVENSGGLLYFGDVTFWPNSESFIRWVRYRGEQSGPINSITGPGVEEYFVRCVITNPCGSLATSPAILSILPDINGDGAVNTLDLIRLLGKFGKTC